jgi:hypothetical protein
VVELVDETQVLVAQTPQAQSASKPAKA